MIICVIMLHLFFVDAEGEIALAFIFSVYVLEVPVHVLEVPAHVLEVVPVHVLEVAVRDRSHICHRNYKHV